MKELKFIADNLNRLSDKEFAAKYNVSVEAFAATRKRHSILRPISAWKFQKGNVPFNKGKAFNAGGRSLETRFSDGRLPHNTKQDGTVTLRTDKGGRRYKYIRLAKGKWQPLHVYNYEQRFGKLPKGYIVVFRTPDTMNCTVENLKAITRAEHCRRNANPKKAGKSLRGVWATVRAFEDYGLTPPFKFRSKRRKAA